MDSIKSILKLQRMVFDKLEFNRKGFQNDNEIAFEIQVRIGRREENDYKVTLVLKGDKQDEYTLEISLSGFFTIETDDIVKAQNLINKNAVAILMPYLRSELTLLTAQPETDSVVLPPFNINKMLDENS